MQNFSIIFLGFGTMGKAAYPALHQVIGRLQTSGLGPHLQGVLEADEAVIKDLPKFIESRGILVDPEARNGMTVAALLQMQLGLQSTDRFLVYDASPSALHRPTSAKSPSLPREVS